MRGMSPTGILLIDDHALFRSGLSMVLRAAIAGVEVREAGSLDEALHATAEAPDVVLLDIQLHGLNGLDGMALLKRQWPRAPIVVLSSDTRPETARQAVERGAAAFVSKAETASAMLAVVNRVIGQEAPASAPATTADSTAEPHLTPRQCEVLDLLCQGLSNKLIGRRLNLSENTVRGHVQALLAVLQVTSRSEAAYAARRRGLVG